MRKDRVRRALTDVFPPTVHVPRCQSPSASSFLSSASARAGGSTRRTMWAGATLGTSASATERGGASPSLTVHGRAGSDRRRPRSKLGRDGALGDAVGGGAGTVGAARGRLPSWARSNVRRCAGGAVSSRWRLRESSAASFLPLLLSHRLRRTNRRRSRSPACRRCTHISTAPRTSRRERPLVRCCSVRLCLTRRAVLRNRTAFKCCPLVANRMRNKGRLPKWHLAACKTLASCLAGLEPHRWP